MNIEPAEQIKEIQKKIALMGILDIPGVVMIALWVYAKYGAGGEPFHPILKNETVVNNLLIFGVLIVVLCGIQVIKLSLIMSKIKNEQNI